MGTFVLIAGGWCMLPIGLVLVALRTAERDSIGRAQPCVSCGYDLVDLWQTAARCPECGHSERGRAAVRAGVWSRAGLVDGCWLGLTWWSMVTLTVLGIWWVIQAGAWIGASQIPR